MQYTNEELMAEGRSLKIIKILSMCMAFPSFILGVAYILFSLFENKVVALTTFTFFVLAFLGIIIFYALNKNK